MKSLSKQIEEIYDMEAKYIRISAEIFSFFHFDKSKERLDRPWAAKKTVSHKIFASIRREDPETIILTSLSSSSKVNSFFLTCFSWLRKLNSAAFFWSLANLFSYFDTFFRVGFMLEENAMRDQISLENFDDKFLLWRRALFFSPIIFT